MPDPLITLTTDFGWDSPYVAAMKGVILGLCPSARLLDLSHAIPPQDVRHAAFFLRGCLPCYPREALHVVVVDPGVGTDRALLSVDIEGLQLLVPDNGCWSWLAAAPDRVAHVRRLTEPRYWRHPVSATFHGRDILAPVAGHLARGVSPEELGPVTSSWVRLDYPAPVRTPEGWRGEVLFVDHFGNLITNLPAEAIRALPGTRTLHLGKQPPGDGLRWVRTYGEAEPGTLVALFSSVETLEIAVTRGHAASRLNVRAGTPVTVSAG